MTLMFHLKAGFAVFIFLNLFASFAEADTLIGFQEGDWIEYTVKTTGLPPKEFEVTWAKIEIVSIEGKVIHANVTTRFPDGSLSSRLMTFDLEKGQVGAWFIIPSGLNVGESFWDCSLNRNVIVEGEEQLSFAGAIRAVTNATTPQRIKYWDKVTGVFVECVDVFDNYSINATAIKTNIWSAEKSEHQRNNLSSVIVVGVGTLVVIAVSTFFFAGIKRDKKLENSQ